MRRKLIAASLAACLQLSWAQPARAQGKAMDALMQDAGPQASQALPSAPPVRAKAIPASSSPLHPVLLKMAELQRRLLLAHSNWNGLRTPPPASLRSTAGEVVSHDALMDYYARAVETLSKSNSISIDMARILIEESAGSAADAPENRALRLAALQFQGLEQRAKDSLDLVATLQQAAQRVAKLAGPDVLVKNPESLVKLYWSANRLLAANRRAAERAVAVLRIQSGDFGDGPILVIPADASPEQARTALSQALGEAKTTFLLLRSSPANEVDAGVLAGKAAHLAARENPAEWRVVWIRNQDLLPRDTIRSYFGDAEEISAVTLRWGTGEAREGGCRYELKHLDGYLDIVQAFAEAGPQ